MTGCTATRHGSLDAYNKFRCRCPDARAKKVRSNAQVALRKLAGEPGLIDATGTRRRIQALHAIGWRARDLAPLLDRTDSAVRQLKWRDTVQRTTAQAVAKVYAALAEKAGPSPLLAEKAKGWGWLAPKWWDDDLIDDPAYEPPTQQDVHWSDVDPIAVERAIAGDRLRLTRAERIHAVRRMRADGASLNAIAKRLRMEQRQVLRDIEAPDELAVAS